MKTKLESRIGHVMTVRELMAALKRAPKGAVVLIERSAAGKLKPMTVGEAFPHRIHGKNGRVEDSYFKLCPTSVSDAMHRSIAPAKKRKQASTSKSTVDGARFSAA